MSSVKKRFVIFDKQRFKKSKNVVVVIFCNVEYSVAVENKVFNRRRVSESEGRSLSNVNWSCS
jgi:hypothetical protein